MKGERTKRQANQSREAGENREMQKKKEWADVKIRATETSCRELNINLDKRW